ncbi:uncharacterized protein HD556DRAFT_953672 [Suillus plorans]|uniref:Uncharacterized protein n=1 Tax=Suillus plorans TaxID=116603 RepID=A0A9P7AFK6_9AGAM|nr:uncharacterized protein HD556DRAFT_953672 [Suillus plorans]KAG1787428.1 hypothetical protein HD556DRAFT_953672 [Suillus plorans]
MRVSQLNCYVDDALRSATMAPPGTSSHISWITLVADRNLAHMFLEACFEPDAAKHEVTRCRISKSARSSWNFDWSAESDRIATTIIKSTQDVSAPLDLEIDFEALNASISNCQASTSPRQVSPMQPLRYHVKHQPYHIKPTQAGLSTAYTTTSSPHIFAAYVLMLTSTPTYTASALRIIRRRTLVRRQ